MRLADIQEKDPKLYAKLVRYLMGYLHRRKMISIADLEREVALEAAPDRLPADPNRPSPRGRQQEIDVLNARVVARAEQLLSEAEISTIIHLANKNEMIIELGQAADNPAIPFDEVVARLHQFCQLFHGTAVLDVSDAIGTRVSLIRRFLSDQLEYINIAKNFLSVRKIAAIVDRIIVPDGQAGGAGRVGGKAAGLILAQHILEDAYYRGKLKEFPRVPRAYYLRSDGVLDFIQFNNLEELTNIKYRNPEEIQKEHPIVERVFKNAAFPPKMLAGLTRVLEDFHGRPLVVRSSALLEDRVGAAFSGKYKSLFLANRGPMERRLDELTNAIAEIYASTFSPDALIYRKERGLLDFQEEMGILVQEVVGEQLGPYFFPAYAGVAFSQNEFRWSPRIRRDDGMVRLVTGLGTRAVDRTYDDYAFLMSPGQAQLRANVRPDEVAYYSQRWIDVIDTDKGYFTTLPLREVFQRHMDDFPNLQNIVSAYDGHELTVPVGIMFNARPEDLCVTFEGLIARTGFAENIQSLTGVLKESYHCPVDIEFAADSANLWLLQCRPQSQSPAARRVSVPRQVPAEHQLFSAHRYVQNAFVAGVRYVVYVDPAGYEQVAAYEDLLAIGQAVGHLNRTLPRRSFILMGPGRWGSRGDIKLGVRVTYFDINNTLMLIEIARKKGQYVPELSFGTHFFQDLVEAEIRYLPLYPDEPGTVFHERFFRESPSCLAAVAPEYARLDPVVRLLDVEAISGGLQVEVAMDAEVDEALAYLATPR